MKFRLPGATAIAAVMVAMVAAAPLAIAPAHAQNGQAQVQLTKQMVAPMNEARNAMMAKDWATAKTKLDAAAARAKTPVDKAQLERLRLYMASETKDGAAQVASINSLLASGTLTPEEVKQYKGALAKAHLDAGNQPASLAAYKAYIDEYGGTPDQLISIANDYMKANDAATAATYADKAINAQRANGKVLESWYKLNLRALNALGQMDKYYALLETLVAEYPNEAYWRDMIARVQKEPKYGIATRLDLFRTLDAAGVKLTSQEVSLAGDEALKRGLPNEALKFLEPAGVTSEFDTKNLASAKSLAASDKAGLAKETAEILKKGDAAAIASIGEAHLSYGDNAKAIEVLQAALAKGISDADEAALVKLHLGIAQFRSGDEDAARATWAEVKSDNGATVLAHNWTLISKLK
jgi:tetratricopeptide (TPR) repeat protein